MLSASLFSQVKIGGLSSPEASAILELESSNRGLIVPRLTSVQRDAISAPTSGLMIFNITNAAFEVYKTTCSCWVIIKDEGSVPTLNKKPKSLNVTYPQTPALGSTLVGSYTYSDSEGDLQAGVTYKWYRADDQSGAGQQVIAGETTAEYITTGADLGKYIGFSVTVTAQTGTVSGNEIIFYNSNPVLAEATYTFTSKDVMYLPFFYQGKFMNVDNSIQVEINVTVPGTIIISSNTTNGYTFTTKSFVFDSPGLKWITLQASGFQTAFNASGDNFTLTGSASQTKNFTIRNSSRGQDITLSNGTTGGNQPFSANTSCMNNIISQGLSASDCVGPLVIGANSYGTVLINGQCWMTRNYAEQPNGPCSDFINTGCNQWVAPTTINDEGKWGFYNTTASATMFSTSAPTNFSGQAGLLYQWSAAMEGSTTERAKGVCPIGWHIPSDCEWKYLEHGLGMSIADQNAFGSQTRNSGDVPSKLTFGHALSVGFNMRPTGWRNGNGTFQHITVSSSIFTSTLNGTNVFSRRGIEEYNHYGPNTGASIRCLKN